MRLHPSSCLCFHPSALASTLACTHPLWAGGPFSILSWWPSNLSEPQNQLQSFFFFSPSGFLTRAPDSVNLSSAPPNCPSHPKQGRSEEFHSQEEPEDVRTTKGNVVTWTGSCEHILNKSAASVFQQSRSWAYIFFPFGADVAAPSGPSARQTPKEHHFLFPFLSGRDLDKI